MNLDIFFCKVYHKKNYNCAHFVAEVWKYLTGEDISYKLNCFFEPEASRKFKLSDGKNFKRVNPSNDTFSIALMQRAGHTPHVGIFINGRILHIHENGVECQPVDVASRGFKRVRYYI